MLIKLHILYIIFIDRPSRQSYKSSILNPVIVALPGPFK